MHSGSCIAQSTIRRRPNPRLCLACNLVASASQEKGAALVTPPLCTELNLLITSGWFVVFRCCCGMHHRRSPGPLAGGPH
jgi:hypothetical protein